MITKPITIEELKRDFELSFRSNCGDKVSKFSDLSVINGFSYAISKIVQKINKNSGQIEAKLFPEGANSTALDDIAPREGISTRRGASGSSVPLLFRAPEGTVYNIHTQAQTPSGIVFDTNSALTIDATGFGFVLAESTSTGEQTNIMPNSVSIMVTAAPTGHISVTNLVRAVGGLDAESDYTFRKRIQSSEFLLSRNTNSFYQALINNINSNVLRIKTKASSTANNEFTIILLKNSLANFSNGDITDIKNGIQDNLPLSDYNSTKLNIVNIDWTGGYIDIYAPIRKVAGANLDTIVNDMQIACNTYLDLSKWNWGQKVDWTSLFELCSNVDGVREINDVDFTPHSDIIITEDQMPRLRAFTVYDIDNDVTSTQALTNSFFIHDVREDRIFASIIS